MFFLSWRVVCRLGSRSPLKKYSSKSKSQSAKMPLWSECLQPPPFVVTSFGGIRKETGNRDISIANNEEGVNFRQPRPLIDLCSEKAISDAGLCENCLHAGLTPELFDHLFTAAVEKSKDLSIQTLISNWPHTSLSLASHGGRSEKDYERQLHRWLTGDIRRVDERDGVAALSVMQAFMNSLRERTPSKLRVLDLRGYPCIDYGIEYLTGHSMLAYNESQRAGIIRLVQDMATSQRITPEQASAFGDLTETKTTLPDSTYTVILDCVIESEGRALVELCKTLKITPFTHAHLKLIINHLHLNEVGYEYVELVMPLLNPVHLVGLNLAFNSLQAAGLNHVLGSLEVGKFDALQSLDLGNNNIDFSLNDLACQHFSSAFARLRQLKRLDLRGNRLSRRLRTLFSPALPPAAYPRLTPARGPSGDSQDDFFGRRLEYLNLSGCRLMESDFIFLSNTTLIDEIRELDLSDNNFSSSTSSMCCILKRIRPTVRALRLERCGLRDQQADRVIGAHLALMTSLLALSLSDNAWSNETYRQEMPKLVKGCVSLRGVRISYPTECYQLQAGDHDQDEEQIQLARQMRKTQFFCNLSRSLESAGTPARPFRLVCAELDEALL